MKKLRVVILFGGRSAEHEVSIQSARNVYNALDKKKYDPVLVGITKTGQWISSPTLTRLFSHPTYSSQIPAKIKKSPINPNTISQLLSPSSYLLTPNVVVFPILHGPYGEDGTVQGLLKLANLPFVGASILGSAVGMDKDVQKRLLCDAGIPVAKFITITNRYTLTAIRLRFPVFVKPANLGSSVGVTLVKRERDLLKSIRLALKFDRKVLIEEAIEGRELEVSIIGNENPIASTPGEVIPRGKHQFYDYSAKYLDENGAALKIPAKLPKSTVKKIQKTAIKAYQTLCCEGMARVDMFLTLKGNVYINEINTIPGFTNISMYPKLWEASGLSQSKLLDKLIGLALDRFKKEQKLKISR